ncbi:unnamed protein product [Polarella glacialis]|uniref:Uncharacterized protein n=1 Tax=Polarella glacialis TaxID=89957 RepID=A0A813IHI4_POLGL|nr:unnamed protein product [Polarella glacialis]
MEVPRVVRRRLPDTAAVAAGGERKAGGPGWQPLSWLPTFCLAAISVASVVALCTRIGREGALDGALHEYYEQHPEEFRRRLQVAQASDEELREVIAEVSRGGPQAVLRHLDNEALLLRLSEKMGGVPDEVWAAAPPQLHEAARLGAAAAVAAALRVLPPTSSVDSVDERGMTALAIAAAHGHAEAVSSLLEARADPRSADGQGNSVLHFAAGYGRKAVCDVLRLHLGPSDAHRINALGQMAADVARVNRHDVVVLLGDLQPSSS